ncbi:putative EF-hand domain pair, deubiquitinating enzyme MINDY-3/4 domain-containing protein [Helianthus annuus]|nr:putative EF-hand domain pair, deubiquitinating enzyme MINDY-3/4 domain-containing protein [Helianthus annuus]KAJ0519866.1 putative EF-hand domain pair, deubiquitinating enzyme MINDY-3/4 domain-containing protein [Helianthus annuus]KAJ0695428.1 putative EF-hand domain pair, deubiquitinating enzyme MINDY-3/4 domain-containing protein [Helianthus annuus]KAJ0698888.1 putative EF-hand domain pair, deubiquitinating enzyme MINDY-3/4 domain-containing protein [Helianthus annuus]KAJ0877810.1 putative
MEDHVEDDLQKALRMSMQYEPPEPKRSKDSPMEESPEVKNRRLQRELMAAAAEKRMAASASAAVAKSGGSSSSGSVAKSVCLGGAEVKSEKVDECEPMVKEEKSSGEELALEQAHQLFSMVFGNEVSKGILAQWSNQGIRFSPDEETSMGLVQHEGGPCGVLAAIQAFVLKYLLFFPQELVKDGSKTPIISVSKRLQETQDSATNIFGSLTEETKSRALVRSMGEILFLCGNNNSATIASLKVLDHEIEGKDQSTKDEIVARSLDGLSIESGGDLQKALKVTTFTSLSSAMQRLEEIIPIFRSRMGALLFLLSALLSRGLETVQADRDDPTQPLVTAPFGHASQEIVNLLLSGMAVANVFDGKMDLGGGMFVKGILTPVEVGFLTLLESLNFCKVGQSLKSPKWPIWVIGSESHYTVLFALDPRVQEENEFESRETTIRRAFDAQDQSGGGGFISVEGFHQVLKDANVNLPADKVNNLCSSGFIVWSEFWQVLLDLDKSLGGLKDSTGLMGKKVFDLYHFNGIAKSVLGGSGGETPVQRPRLTKLRVSVPPRWTPEEFMANVSLPGSSSGSGGGDGSGTKDAMAEVSKPEPAQHAPLVDCIRTRWARAVCNWEGDPPSIV